MSAVIVLGAQWGDEGKGKIVDILCNDGVQLCCRAQGGHNAGHTIVKTIGGKKTTFDVHILPSGVLTDGCVNLIGSGCVVYIPNFFKEIDTLEKHGISTKDRVLISDRCHVDLDLHTKVDGLEEAELGKGNIGTTKKGIGPTYSTKAARNGVRIEDIFIKETFDEKLRNLANGYQKRYGDLLQYDVEDEIARFDDYRVRLEPYIVDQMPLIASAVQGGVKMLVEGSQALMLDIDHGTYPFVTSSNTGWGGVINGLHLNTDKVRERIGVVKAYTTRVGSGPFPTEQLNEVGERLQEIGREFGVTTGRRRRCGWLDLVVVGHSYHVNWYHALNLTKLDVLDDFDEVKIATGYRIDGKTTTSFPANLAKLEKAEVVYETLPGWKSSTMGARRWEDLPENARRYVEFIEKSVGVPVKYVGTGPGNEDIIIR